MNRGELLQRGWAFCLLALLTCAGCQPSTRFQTTDKIKIVATTGMLADLANNIGGDQVEVIALMGSGVDPHLYRPTAGDVNRIAQADLVFFGGLHLEGRMGHVFETLAAKSLDVGSFLPPDEIIYHSGQPDPHVWHDPVLWESATNSVAARLAEYRPQCKDQFLQAAKDYISKLELVNQETVQMFQQIPEESRIIVTAHDAFTYFGRRYGLEVLGIQGTNTTTEASAQHMVSLADIIAKNRIKAIFVESSVNHATIEALQQAVKKRGWDVKIGGQLYSDAMGASGTEEGTYLGMIRANVRTITEALK